ncbi:MAG: hypothetical protein NC394_07985 [Bacteroides sp.]|nr:hypothetical protein [Bacteroides sp.]
MKIAINILKVLEIIITAVWGIIFGILTPLVLMSPDIVVESISGHYILWVWIINSALCYCVGTIIVMLSCYKTALCFHGVGLIVSLFIYGTFQGLYEGIDAQNPSVLYMPVILVTFLTLAITVIANYKKINERLSTVKEKKYEAAPSVLGGQYEMKRDDRGGRSEKK